MTDDERRMLGGETGATSFLALVQACAVGCGDHETFRQLIRKHAKPMLPFRSAVAAFGTLSCERLISPRLTIGIDYPQALPAPIRRELDLRERPLLTKWIECREPMVVDLARDRAALCALAVREIEAYGPGRLAMHGQVDVSAKSGSHFAFTGAGEHVTDERLKFLLRLIAPHLHAALTSIPGGEAADEALHQPSRLMAVERDLVAWLAAGRSTAQIAQIRGRSGATVRNQLHALYRKLGVTNRAEAVAVAGPRRG